MYLEDHTDRRQQFSINHTTVQSTQNCKYVSKSALVPDIVQCHVGQGRPDGMLCTKDKIHTLKAHLLHKSLVMLEGATR